MVDPVVCGLEQSMPARDGDHGHGGPMVTVMTRVRACVGGGVV
jgi:hypothetical protein